MGGIPNEKQRAGPVVTPGGARHQSRHKPGNPWRTSSMQPPCSLADVMRGNEWRRGTDVCWEASRIEWALGPVVFALVVLALAFFPSGTRPLASAGGCVLSSATPPSRQFLESTQARDGGSVSLPDTPPPSADRLLVGGGEFLEMNDADPRRLLARTPGGPGPQSS